MNRPISVRIEFSSVIKAALAKRSGFLCAICKAVTVGPSGKSLVSVTNVGVAAHISAASPNGPRHNPSLSPAMRSSIKNGIWLCQNHGKMVDDDSAEWTVSKLRELKRRHEAYVKKMVGVPQKHAIPGQGKVSAPREYAFAFVRELIGPYRALLEPMLRVHKLTGDAELGVLMCGSQPGEKRTRNRETPWTLFVKPEWLRWVLSGQSAGYRPAKEISADQIYGQIPAWPDEFFEFLEAMVQTGTTFEWQQSAKGYLILAQRASDST